MSSDGADVTSGGRLFQTWGPATGKAVANGGLWVGYGEIQPFFPRTVRDGNTLPQEVVQLGTVEAFRRALLTI